MCGLEIIYSWGTRKMSLGTPRIIAIPTRLLKKNLLILWIYNSLSITQALRVITISGNTTRTQITMHYSYRIRISSKLWLNQLNFNSGLGLENCKWLSLVLFGLKFSGSC